MLKRTITGAVLVALCVGFFFLRTLNSAYFHILISLIALIGTIEAVLITGEKTSLFQKIISVLCSFCVCLFFYLFKETGALISLCVFVIAQFFYPVFTRGNAKLESVAVAIFTCVYPSALLIPLMMTNTLGKISTFALILTFVISPCADVFAYLVGRTFKGKKLCPEISPNKTISGAIGGLIGGMVGSIVVYALTKNTFTYHLSTNPFVYFALVGLLASCLTEIGDLVESYIKRSFGIKDSGKIFPGHGGMLDRFDGLIFASVFIYFVVALF